MPSSRAATRNSPGTRCGPTTPTALAEAGGLPVALPHDPALAAAYLDTIDALVVTGGAFDVDPGLYGDKDRHATVSLKEERTAAELALVRGALARDMPVLGICGGSNCWRWRSAGTLLQHIPDAVADALEHEQTQPARRAEPCGRRRAGHAAGAGSPGRTTMQVNSAHHQAVRAPGRFARGERHRAGRGDRGHRGPALRLLPRACNGTRSS